MSTTRWWHYTLGTTLIRIIADGRIRGAGTHVTRGERRAVWFSRRQTWEPTATKGINVEGERRDATPAEMVEHGGALIRIEVPAAIARHTWAEHRRLSRVDPRVADGLETAAREVGADPDDWRVSYHDVPVSQILSVESWDGTDGGCWTQVGWPATDGGNDLRLSSDFSSKVRAALSRERMGT